MEKRVVGTALLFVSAAKDGSTLFWAADPKTGAPLAKRWGGSEGPWKLQLPLECTAEHEAAPPQKHKGADGVELVDVPSISVTPQGVSICLSLSADPWAYRGGLPTAMIRTQGPRSVVLQVLEGRQDSGSGTGSRGQRVASLLIPFTKYHLCKEKGVSMSFV